MKFFVGHRVQKDLGVIQDKKGLLLWVPRLYMLQVVLCVQQKNSLLVVDNQIVLFVDVGQAAAQGYLDRQNCNEDDHE